MTMEFDCGTVVSGIGAPGLAIASHIGQCVDDACLADCWEQLAKYKNVIV